MKFNSLKIRVGLPGEKRSLEPNFWFIASGVRLKFRKNALWEYSVLDDQPPSTPCLVNYVFRVYCVTSTFVPPTRNIWRLRSCIIVFPFLLRQHGARKESLEAEGDRQLCRNILKPCICRILANVGPRIFLSPVLLPFPSYFWKSSVGIGKTKKQKKGGREKVASPTFFILPE